MARHAILIANDHFPRADNKLRARMIACDHLGKMKDALENLGSPPFTVTQIPNADAVDLEDRLREALKKATADDLVLIYYAGYGRILSEDTGNDLLLATSNSYPDPDKRFRDYSYAEIEERVAGSFKRAVIILDCWDERVMQGGDAIIPQYFSSHNYSPVECEDEPDQEGLTPSNDMKGVYVLTAWPPTGQPGNGSRQNDEFTEQLLHALSAGKSCDVLTLQGLFRQVFEAMEKSPHTPVLIRRTGDNSDLVIADSRYGERQKCSFPGWKPPSNDVRARLSSLAPSYILDAGFRFVDWNALFEDVIAKQLGLVVGCHVMDFVNGLDNTAEVDKRNQKKFPTLTKEKLEHAEETGEIWAGFPPVDVERLEFISDRYRLIVFDKLAYKIQEPGFAGARLWHVQLNVRFVQCHDGYWHNAQDVFTREDRWTQYADIYDRIFDAYPACLALKERVVDHVAGRKMCLQIGAGTGKITMALLAEGDREITAIESHDAMLRQLVGELSRSGDSMDRATPLKGDAASVLERMYRARVEAGESPEIFDACVMTNVPLGFGSPKEYLRAAHQVLKPGAVLSMSTLGNREQVERLMNGIRDHLKEKAKDWPMWEKAWELAREINLELADEAAGELAKWAQLARNAQFKVDDEPGDGECDGRAVSIKAFKPDVRSASRPDPEEDGLGAGSDLPEAELAGSEAESEISAQAETVLESVEPKPHEPDSRTLVKLFVSYARTDGIHATKFLDMLKEQLGPAKEYRYEFWKDTQLIVGEPWDSEIQKALDESDFGLLLVSPSFLNSKYIGEKELNAFFGKEPKPMIPVHFKKVSESHNLRGLDSRQWFGFGTDGLGQAFVSCRKKPEFVQQLFDEIGKKVRKHWE